MPPRAPRCHNIALSRKQSPMNYASWILLLFINLPSAIHIVKELLANVKPVVVDASNTSPCVCCWFTDSREEAVLGSIPLPSYVIAPVEPDDHINRKYAFKVTLKCRWVRHMKSWVCVKCVHCSSSVLGDQMQWFTWVVILSMKKCYSYV